MLQHTDESRIELIASLQQQTEELAELNHIALALTSELDLQRLLQMITDCVSSYTRCCMFLLYVRCMFPLHMFFMHKKEKH